MAADDAALLNAIEGLRSDMREDLTSIRTEIQGVERRMTETVTSYSAAHATEHRDAYTVRDEAHERYDAFIRAAEIAQAQRDGALGVVRFLFELVARHSGALVKVVAAAAAAVLIVNGNVSVAIQ